MKEDFGLIVKYENHYHTNSDNIGDLLELPIRPNLEKFAKKT